LGGFQKGVCKEIAVVKFYNRTVATVANLSCDVEPFVRGRNFRLRQDLSSATKPLIRSEPFVHSKKSPATKKARIAAGFFLNFQKD